MSFSLSRSSDSKKKTDGEVDTAKETDPLLKGAVLTAAAKGVSQSVAEGHGGFIRARRSSKSPVQYLPKQQQYFGQDLRPMLRNNSNNGSLKELGQPHDGYDAIEDGTVHSRQSTGDGGNTSVYSQHSTGSVSSRPGSRQQSVYTNDNRGISPDSRSADSVSQPPLLEIPEEIYAIRKAALQVFKPLTKTWVRTVLFVLWFERSRQSDLTCRSSRTGCDIRWFRLDGTVRNSTMDKAHARASFLVHSVAMLVYTCGVALVACLIGASSLIVHCGSE